MHEASLRKRGKYSNDFTLLGAVDGSLESGFDQTWKFPMSQFVFSLTAGFILFSGISILADNHLPTPILLNEVSQHPAGVFVGERAYKHLERLVSLGPRVAGSYENEVRAVDLLLREIGFIKQFANPVHKITVDVQKPSGVIVPLSKENNGRVDNIIYQSVTNVVVKIQGVNSTDENAEALLVNAHFDSVLGSPGASDNGVSVSIALEVLDLISRQNIPTKHPIIFLFNGSEEKGMLGSHGFITQHTWAKEIGAFINLDACGAGGREIVFQSGPGNSWLIKAYAEAAPHPFASIIGQEIFDAKYIPSDTDFRILKDYGKIPGLDLAYFKNGYVYHTKYDDLNQVSLGSIQRAGNNLLGLVSTLAQMDWPASRDFDDTVIFFDYLGFFMIRFSNTSWHLLNILLVGMAFYQSISWVTAKDSGNLPSNRIGSVCKQVIFSCLAGVFQILGAFFVTWVLVGLVTLFGRTMSWYSRPYLLLGLYGLPALAIALFIILRVSAVQEKTLKSSFLIERVQFEGVKLNLTLLVILTYMFGIRSNVLLLLWLSSAILGRSLLDKLYHQKHIDGVWFLLHFFFFGVPMLQTLYLSSSIIDLLVPIAGRSGVNSNPDLLVALVTVALLLLLNAFICPLIILIRKPKRLLAVMITCHALIAMAVLCTPLGFPYSEGMIDVKPQRVQIMHVERTFYAPSGLVDRREAGYWLFGWDHHIKPETLSPLGATDTIELINESHCNKVAYCGLPYYGPSLKRIHTSYWAPAPKPLIYHPAKIILSDQKLTDINTRSLTFKVIGPDHMALIIWPVQNVELIGWSASKELPEADSFYTERPLYFVTYFYGSQPNVPYELTLDFKVPPSLSGKPILDLALTSHICHGHEHMTNEFASTLKKFPPFVYAYGWTATYSHWSF